MARIALLGSTGQIGRSLADYFSRRGDDLLLLARSPERASDLAAGLAGVGRKDVSHPERVANSEPFDLLVNALGIGDPRRIADQGEGIVKMTRESDELSLSLLRGAPGAMYVFLSSGIVHNHLPAQSDSSPPSPKPEETYYRVAKREAEARHRAMPELPIVDLRLFGFVSRYLDTAGSFFLSETFSAIRDRKEIATTCDNMIRDYVYADDLGRLIEACASAPANHAIDAFTRAPVDKLTLLDRCAHEFGLCHRTVASITSPAEDKPHYYSLDRTASSFGYQPEFNAEEAVVHTFRILLGR